MRYWAEIVKHSDDRKVFRRFGGGPEEKESTTPGEGEKIINTHLETYRFLDGCSLYVLFNGSEPRTILGRRILCLGFCKVRRFEGLASNAGVLPAAGNV
jgi:hypothetical protein